jgi:tRNA-2-methylthio-N6-dimethylallyladenosine synthase
MNVYDSARMTELLASVGYLSVDEPDQADLVILNTCHIREKAAEKVYSELGRLKALKTRPAEQGGPAVIAVAGCVAQAEGDEILRRSPCVDLVVGPQAYHRLPDMIRRTAGRGRGIVDTSFPPDPKFDQLPLPSAGRRDASAFLTVQEGCDKFCTFCVVPYTRGAEYSRPVSDVLAEANAHAAAGVCEITLLGQNVNAYHGRAPEGGSWSLARLIAAIADTPSMERIRYTTSHPNDMADDLIAAHRSVDKLMPFLHLPAQSGSDAILKAMGRRYGRDDYRRVVDRLRGARPDLALSSDFIVGFPGETDTDFAATMTLVEEIGFAHAYSFKYSARPGTPAAAEPQTEDRVKAERLALLQALLDRQQAAFNERSVGRTLRVLFERSGRRPGQLIGRSPHMQAVHVEAPETALNTVQEVRITAGGANSLAGSLVPDVRA